MNWKIMRLTLVAAVWAVATLSALGQDGSSAVIGQGLATDGVFQNFGIDSVNIKNGNVYIDIPVVSLPQRGSIRTMNFDLTLNTSMWQLFSSCNYDINSCGYGYAVPQNETLAYGVTILGTNQYGGIQSLGYNVGPDISTSGFMDAEEDVVSQPGISYASQTPIFHGIDGSGASHQMFMDANDASIFRSIDGSGMLLKYPSGVTPIDIFGGTPQFANATLYDKSGNRLSWKIDSYTDEYNNTVQIVSGKTITDVDGNAIQLAYSGRYYSLENTPETWTDTVGRTLTYPNNGSANGNGCPAPPAGAPLPIGNVQWSAPGSVTPYLLCYTLDNVNTNFWGYGAGAVTNIPCGELTCTFYESSGPNYLVLQSITFPDGRIWKFAYDSAPASNPTNKAYYGQLSRIVFPTGGAISYCYQLGVLYSAGQNVYTPSGEDINPETAYITSRIETAQDVAVDCTSQESPSWKYNYGYYGQTVTVTDPDDNDIVHTFNYNEASPATYEDQYIDPTKNESSRDYYQGSALNGKKIKSISYNLQNYIINNVPFPTVPTVSLPGGSITYLFPSNNINAGLNAVQVDSTTIRYPSTFNAVVFSCSTFPYYGCVYGTPQTVPLGMPTLVSNGIQSKTTQYLWQTNTSYLYANLLDAVSSVTIQDSTPSAKTVQYGYDETGYVSSGLGLGHLTSATGVLSSGTNVTSHTHYGAYGMPDGTTDAMRTTTSSVQQWDTQHLFPTKILTPLGTMSATHNLDTGALLSSTDVNGQTTTYGYDSTNRPQSVKYPDLTGSGYSTYFCYIGASTVVSYQAQSVPVNAPSTCGAPESNAIVTANQLDPMGRPSSTSIGGDADDVITTSVKYYPSGRLYQQSTPYRLGSNVASTTYHYDPLGRIVKLDQPDGVSQKTWQYGVTSIGGKNFATTTATDEVGNQVETVSDALGRTVEVLEPNVNSYNTLTVSTLYTYNVYGVTNILQSGDGNGSPRSRSFSYDSLSRLVTASNPESGLVCYGTLNLGACAESYDANGNLKAKTDAGGVITIYTYDSLNRLTAAVPSDPNGTPSSCYAYDSLTVPNGIGRLFTQWTQKGNCPSTPGSGVQTQTTVRSYDPMGRVTASTQCILTRCTQGYPFTSTQFYNLNGSMTYWDNGIKSIGFTPNYDTHGRLVGLSSTWNDPTHPAALLSVPGYASPSSVGFTPTGALQQWTLGDDLNFTRTYDSRSRVTSETATKP